MLSEVGYAVAEFENGGVVSVFRVTKLANSPWACYKMTVYLRLVGWSAVHPGQYEHEKLPSYVNSLHCIFLHKRLSRISWDPCGAELLLSGHTARSAPG